MKHEATLGQRIRELRGIKNMTQRELAEAVARRLRNEDGRGFDFTYLSKIENDRMRPSSVAIAQLAEVLGADLDELMALAGRLPDDIEGTLTGSSGARAFFRSAHDLNLSEADWKSLLQALQDRKDKKRR